MTHRVLVCWALMILGSNLAFVLQVQADGLGMVTGSRTSTSFHFGQDIARVAQTEGIDILVKESEGSVDNIRRLMSGENAALGFVQSDVLEFLRWSQDADIHHIAGKLRLAFPFYNEEVHLFARKQIERFEDLHGKRVVVGTEGSGDWLTANNLLRLLKIEPVELINNLSPPEAVRAVLTNRADAMFYVAGKPVKPFLHINDLKQDPRYAPLVQEVHFVPLEHKTMLREYVASTIGPKDYAWVDTTIPTVAVKAVLISFDFSGKHNAYFQRRCEQLAQLGRAVQTNLATLEQTGHAKWQEVDLDQKLNLWERDTCLQPARSVFAKDEQLLKDLVTSLKKGLSR